MSEQDILDAELSPDNAVDIPNFDTEEAKPAFVPGTYLFALGRITPKVENGVTMSVAQKYWALKFIGDPFQPTNEWRIHFDSEGKLFMPDHKGTMRMEFFDNPMIKPKMKWKTSAFYKLFPGALVDKASPTPGSDKPTKQVDWKVVSSLYGQIFQADLVVNEYTSKKEGSNGKKIKGIQMDMETIVILAERIPIDRMLAIESRYEQSKTAEGTDSMSYAKQPTAEQIASIDDDGLPF